MFLLLSPAASPMFSRTEFEVSCSHVCVQVNEYKAKLADAEAQNLSLHKQLEAAQLSARGRVSETDTAPASAATDVTDATAVATIALLCRQLDDAG
jgi:hypothetical protein